MRVLLAGASGAVGAPITRALLASGHEVVALTRRRGGAPAGTTELVGDALDRDGLLAAVRGLRADAVMHQLTALKKAPMRHRDLEATNRLRTEGTANLLAAARAVGARRFVTQSNLFGYGYGNLGEHFHTERDAFGKGGYGHFDQHIAALHSTEQQAFNTEGVEGIALRYGAFYGAPGDPVVEMLKRGQLPAVKGGPISFIHVEDVAAATVAALERGRGGEAYNVVDDEPAPWRDFFRTTAAHLGAPAPKPLPGWMLRPIPIMHAIMTGSYRLSNAKARAELGWAPSMPTFREGIASIRA
ncbi:MULTISPECIES: NAD-dependent epimerase/dehydratase family protein [Glycomyces]|uniref:NAD-dependent epimerase/dehydratase family protein n=2 Tax=Glycomyces TaxID=58113 RepID=A0A9X3PHI7_9ACTN|nr:NAD-dependent epimerase/dehydratase family protein [Glycomyces lechevalierae]MDA1383756.1 NAD-dependent epimerase/dehydratase family protein [Glycomyces lechevalierae]MDR7341253.1 nucleoside-diphosphate-sugar epimerase [Glycomyces lechevalierae]